MTAAQIELLTAARQIVDCMDLQDPLGNKQARRFERFKEAVAAAQNERSREIRAEGHAAAKAANECYDCGDTLHPQGWCVQCSLEAMDTHERRYGRD